MKSSDSNYLCAIIQRCVRRESGGPRVSRSWCENPRRDSLLPARCWLTKFLREVSASGIPDGPPGEDRRAGKGGRDGRGAAFFIRTAAAGRAPEGREFSAGPARGEGGRQRAGRGIE